MELWEFAESLAQERGREVSPQRAAAEMFARSKESSSQRRRAVLEALQAGPKTTAELIEAGGHRFSCAIDQLRKRGHQIDTRDALDGDDKFAVYTLTGYTPTFKVKQSEQQAYYASQHWKDTSRARKEFDNWTCTQCHSKENLETHHWVYFLFRESVEHELVTLCSACHKTIHRRTQIHFPRFVDEETSRRLACLPVS